MGRLPTELVDRIMLDHMDAQTLGVLYDRGALKDMVSAPAAREIEAKVLRKARGEHNRLLARTLERLRYHYLLRPFRMYEIERVPSHTEEVRARLAARGAARARWMAMH